MRLQQPSEYDQIGGTMFEGLPKHIKRIVECASRQELMTSFSKGSSGLGRHSLFKVAFSQLDAQLSILRIEIRDLAQDFETVLGRARLIVSIRYGEVVSARFDDEILLSVQIGEVGRDFCIVRLQTIDLLEHRDRFESKILFAVVLGDAAETG